MKLSKCCCCCLHLSSWIETQLIQWNQTADPLLLSYVVYWTCYGMDVVLKKKTVLAIENKSFEVKQLQARLGNEGHTLILHLLIQSVCFACGVFFVNSKKEHPTWLPFLEATVCVLCSFHQRFVNCKWVPWFYCVILCILYDWLHGKSGLQFRTFISVCLSTFICNCKQFLFLSFMRNILFRFYAGVFIQPLGFLSILTIERTACLSVRFSELVLSPSDLCSQPARTKWTTLKSVRWESFHGLHSRAKCHCP